MRRRQALLLACLTGMLVVALSALFAAARGS
jgi:hypothetical protein